jgi:hypothetical protein
MARAELLREARKRGIPVTGTETVAQLETYLQGAGESQEQIDAEAMLLEEPDQFRGPIPTEPDAAAEEQAAKVAGAKTKVDEAKTKLAEANAEYAVAVDEHAALSKPVAVYGKHILLETGVHGEYSLADAPPNWEMEKPYRLLIGGQNYEHTSTVDATGVWIYRRTA